MYRHHFEVNVTSLKSRARVYAPKYFCGRVPWLYQYWPGGFMLFVVLCPGTPEGSTGSGSGFKASQKTGQRLKVSSDRLGEAGNQRVAIKLTITDQTVHVYACWNS